MFNISEYQDIPMNGDHGKGIWAINLYSNHRSAIRAPWEYDAYDRVGIVYPGIHGGGKKPLNGSTKGLSGWFTC